MVVKFKVGVLPPKKDGANSMWNKGTERERLKALRLAAYKAMGENRLLSGPISMTLTLSTFPKKGTLITSSLAFAMALWPRIRTLRLLVETGMISQTVPCRRNIVYRYDASICQIVARAGDLPVRSERACEVIIEQVEADWHQKLPLQSWSIPSTIRLNIRYARQKTVQISQAMAFRAVRMVQGPEHFGGHEAPRGVDPVGGVGEAQQAVRPSEAISVSVGGRRPAAVFRSGPHSIPV